MHVVHLAVKVGNPVNVNPEKVIFYKKPQVRITLRCHVSTQLANARAEMHWTRFLSSVHTVVWQSILSCIISKCSVCVFQLITESALCTVMHLVVNYKHTAACRIAFHMWLMLQLSLISHLCTQTSFKLKIKHKHQRNLICLPCKVGFEKRQRSL